MLRHLLRAIGVIVAAIFCQQALATLAITYGATADGFEGYIGQMVEVSGSGTMDVQYVNYRGSDYYYKRAACGGAVATYFTLPLTGTATLGGLTVTMVSAGSSSRTYRFLGIPLDSAQPFCFVSADSYANVTATSTASSTPTPSISNLRVVDDTAIIGGKKLCIDYTPVNPNITSFNWIENGSVRASGAASNLWASYTCWDRNTTLVAGSSYTVQLSYTGGSGTSYSNILSIVVPVAFPGSVSNFAASVDDATIPGKIRLTWTATANATSYDIWDGNAGGVLISGYAGTSMLVTPGTPAAPTGYYFIMARNAFGVGPWSGQTTGRAALAVPPTCAAITTVASVVTATTPTIRVSANGVQNATSVSFSAYGVVNGTGDETTTPGVNGGGGTWYADIPLTSGPHAPEYGPFVAYGVLFGSSSAIICGNPGVPNFTRREPQGSTFVSQTIAGVTDPASITLLAGRNYPVSVSFNNSGQSTWKHATSTGASSGHKLGTLTPTDNASYLGGSRMLLGGTTTPPSATATATGTINTSNLGAGVFQLSLVEEGLERFGAASTSVAINVVAASSAATNVVASDGIFGDRVRVTWTPGANIAYQNVLRAAPGTAYPAGVLTAQPANWTVLCPSVAPAVATCDDTSAEPGTNYEYRVFGWSGAAGSANGGWDQGASSTGDTGFALAPLTTAPQNLTASISFTDRVQLNWSSFNGAASFELQRTLDDGARTLDGALITGIAGSLVTYGDTVPPRGLGRCYKIRGVNAAGSGPWSNEACGMKLALQAPALSATQGTATGLTRLTWGAASGYVPVTTQLWRLINASDLTSWELLTTLPGSPGTWDDSSARGADIAVDYYRLQQADAAGNSTAYTMSSTSSFSQNVAVGYANFAPTKLNVNPIQATATTPSSTQSLTVDDPNQSAGQPESATFTVVSQINPTTSGSCVIASNTLQWVPDSSMTFAGSTSCTIQATDRGGASITSVVNITVSAVDNASAGIFNAPAYMKAGQSNAVSVSFTNTGSTTWTPPQYAVAVINPVGNTTWGASATNVTHSVSRPSVYTAAINAIAPATPGTYAMQFQMRNGSTLFGQASANKNIIVQGAPTCSSTIQMPAATTPLTTGMWPVSVTGVLNAESVSFSVSSVSAPGDLRSYPAVNVGGVWTAQVDLAMHAPGAPTYGAIKVDAVTSNTAWGSVTCATSTFERTTAAPANVKATDGTVTGSVAVAWDGIVGATFSNYVIVECDAASPAPTWNADRSALLGQACSIAGSVSPSTLTYSVPRSDASVKYYGVSSSAGPVSTLDAGYANLAPTAAVLIKTVTAGAVSQLLGIPVVTDANGNEAFTFSLADPQSAAPKNLTVSANGVPVSLDLTSGRFTYSPTIPAAGALPTNSPGALTTDSFVFYAFDRVGAVVAGLAKLTVCPVPVTTTIAAAAGVPLTASGAVSRLACNGVVSVGYDLRRIGASATAGSGGTSSPSVSNEAVDTRFNVLASSFDNPVAFDNSVTSRTGLYEVRALLADALGGKSTSLPALVDIECGAPLLSIGTYSANFKRGEIRAASTVKLNDECQFGLSYSLDVVRALTPSDVVGPTGQATWPSPGYVISALNQSVPVSWATTMPPRGDYLLKLTANNATRTVKSITAPLAVACPDPVILSATATARSALTTFEVAVSKASCSPAIVGVQISPTFAASPLMLSGTPYDTNTDVYSVALPYPPTDGTQSVPITIGLADSRVITAVATVTYDARSSVPLYTITTNNTAAIFNSLGRIVLSPKKQ